MKTLSTTRLSSKGQIVIPEDVRNRLALHSGDQFVVVGEQGVIILKLISEPSLEKFDYLVKKAQIQAHQAGLKKPDVKAAIKEARKQK
jgi:AbrB family looped-hinge helix DNA binding protein